MIGNGSVGAPHGRPFPRHGRARRGAPRAAMPRRPRSGCARCTGWPAASRRSSTWWIPRWSSSVAASPGPEPRCSSRSRRFLDVVEWRPFGRACASSPPPSANGAGALGAARAAMAGRPRRRLPRQGARPARGRRGPARSHRAGRRLVRGARSWPAAWSTSSAPATAASWSRRCGRATAPSPASTPSSSCRSPSTTWSSARTASARPCSWRTCPGSPSASCGTSTSRPRDSALVVSSSGGNVVSVEMAEGFRRRGVKVVAIVSRAHAEATPTRHPRGLQPHGLRRPRARHRRPGGRRAWCACPASTRRSRPGSTVGGCLLVNAIKAEVAERLTAAGQPPHGPDRRRASSGPSAPRRSSKPPTTSTRGGWRGSTRAWADKDDRVRGPAAAHHRHRQLPVAGLARVRLAAPRASSARPTAPSCRTTR